MPVVPIFNQAQPQDDVSPLTTPIMGGSSADENLGVTAPSPAPEPVAPAPVANIEVAPVQAPTAPMPDFSPSPMTREAEFIDDARAVHARIARKPMSTEEAGAALAFSVREGIPYQAVVANPELLAMAVKPAPDWQTIAGITPVVAKALRDERSARLWDEEVNQISFIEKAYKKVAKGWQAAGIQNELAGVTAQLRDTPGFEGTPELNRRREELKARLQAVNQEFPDFGAQVGQVAGSMVEPLKEGLRQGSVTGIAFGAGTLALTRNPAAAAQGARAGFQLGMGLGSYQASERLETNMAWEEFVDSGIPPEIAEKWAPIAGSLSGAVEMMQVQNVAGLVPGFKDFIDEGIRRGLKNTLLKGLKTQAGKAALDYAGAVAENSIQEGIQRAIVLTGKRMAIEQANQGGGQLNPITVSDIVAEALEETMSTIGPMAVIGGLPGSFNIVASLRSDRQAEAMDRATRQTPPVTKQALDIVEDAGKTKAAQQIPESAASILQEFAKTHDGPQRVYIDAELLERQIQGDPDPQAALADLAGKMGFDLADYDEAVRQGLSIEVEFGALAHLVQSPFWEAMRAGDGIQLEPIDTPAKAEAPTEAVPAVEAAPTDKGSLTVPRESQEAPGAAQPTEVADTQATPEALQEQAVPTAEQDVLPSPEASSEDAFKAAYDQAAREYGTSGGAAGGYAPVGRIRQILNWPQNVFDAFMENMMVEGVVAGLPGSPERYSPDVVAGSYFNDLGDRFLNAKWRGRPDKVRADLGSALAGPPSAAARTAVARPVLAERETARSEIARIAAEVEAAYITKGMAPDRAKLLGKVASALFALRAKQFARITGKPEIEYFRGFHRIRVEGAKESEAMVEAALKRTGRSMADGKKYSLHGVIRRRGRDYLIQIFESGKTSTIFHEAAHLFRDELEDLAMMEDGPAWVKRDWAAVCEWVGAKVGETWTSAQEEQWAKTFETYLLEGKAPNAALTRLFEVVRRWMMEAYHIIARYDGVNLTPEIRAIFNRMLVEEMNGENAVAREAIPPVNPVLDVSDRFDMDEVESEWSESSALFDGKPPWLSDEEWATYTEKKQKAWTSATSRAHERRAKMERAAATTWKRLGKEAAEKNPGHVFAQGIVDKGGLNKADLLEYGSKIIRQLSALRAGLVVDEGGVTLADVATETGISPDDVVNRLQATPSIKTLTAQYVAERKADYVADRSTLEVHATEEYMDFMHYQAQTLVKRTTIPSMEKIRETIRRKTQNVSAERMVKESDALRAGLKKAEAVSRQMARDEQKRINTAYKFGQGIGAFDQLQKVRVAANIGKEANTAVKVATVIKKRVDTAYSFGFRKGIQKELFRHIYILEQMRQREAALRKVKSTIALAKRMARTTVGKPGQKGGLTYDVQQQIRQLVGRFMKVAQKARENTPSLDFWVTSIMTNPNGTPSGVIMDIADWVRYETGSPASRTVTVNTKNGPQARTITENRLAKMPLKEVLAVRDAFEKVYEYGRNEQVTMASNMQQTFDAQAAAMVAQAAKLKPWEKDQTLQEHLTPLAQKGPLARAAAWWDKARAECRKIENYCIMLDLGNPNGPFWSFIFSIIAESEREELIHGQRILDMFNKAFDRIPRSERKTWRARTIQVPGVPGAWSKEQIICLGLNAGTDYGYKNLAEGYADWGLGPAEIDALLNTIIPAEWNVIQDIWGLYADVLPALKRTYRTLTGSEMVIEKGRDIQTPHGVVHGMYFPIEPDPVLNGTEYDAIVQSAQNFVMSSGLSKWASTRSGMTKARTGAVSKVKLDFSVIGKTLADHLHHAHYALAVRDVNKLIFRQDVKNAIVRGIGQNGYAQFVSWIQAVAGDRDIRTQSTVDGVVGVIANSVTVARMGLKLSVFIAQWMSATQSIAVVKAGPFLKASTKFLLSPIKTWREVTALTPALSQRMGTWDREMKRMLSSGFNPYGKGIREHMVHAFFWPISMADMTLAIPTWMAAYENAMEANGGNKELSIREADQVLRSTQPTALTKDLSAIQRGVGTQRLFTMFFTFFNAYDNLASRYGYLLRQNQISYYQGARAFMFLTVIPGLLSWMYANRELPDDPEDFASALLQYHISRFPVIRDFIGIAVNPWDYNITPAAAFGQGLSRFFQAASAENVDATKVALEGVNVAGLLTGWIPSAQAVQTIKGILAIEAGETDGFLESASAVMFGPEYENKRKSPLSRLATKIGLQEDEE